jgi:hypothetical protein
MLEEISEEIISVNGCETWSLTLREEHILRVFENRMLRTFGPKRDEMIGGLCTAVLTERKTCKVSITLDLTMNTYAGCCCLRNGECVLIDL